MKTKKNMRTGIGKYIYFDTSNLRQDIQRSASLLLLALYFMHLFSPVMISEASANEIIYPLKQISKLECRFEDFDTLSGECKQDLPILYTKDYVKYATQNSGYNDYTRLYTMLWGASYTYGWDIGNGGHQGVDIATAKGTPVFAITNGVVLMAENSASLGNTVAIKHIVNGQTIVSSYSHLSKISVNKGENVTTGQKIGEVGSTGNSTGNHLHFQIDTSTNYGTPAYYDYKTCPYSYYQITEQGACFGELQKMTMDPLLFLETKGAALSNLPSYETSPTADLASNGVDMGVFNRTVNVGYPINDIKTVQQIMKDLGYYNGSISGNYNDVIEDIIAYQITRGVIANRDSDGAGNFGPATRKQAKTDYDKYLAGNPSLPTGGQEVANTGNNNSNQVTISKEKLLTREEIEAMEVEEFMKDYNIDLQFRNNIGNISVGGKEIIDLTITDKRRGRPFVGNMPGGMTFVVDNATVNLFPTKILNFTDGKREIEVTGLKEGTTKMYIKVGTVTVKTFNINVYNGQKTIYPESADQIGSTNAVLGNIGTTIVAFRDKNRSLLVNISFGSTYKLVASEGNKVCIKSGDIKDASSIYATPCKDEDFKSEITFTYKDTLNGILLYDYKALNKNATFKIVNADNKELTTRKMLVSEPKGLQTTYAYRDEVLKTIQDGVSSGLKVGYFQENNELTQYDAYTWLRNYLINLNNATSPTSSNKSKVENNLREVARLQSTVSKYEAITRLEFLNLASKYLIIDAKDVAISIKYKDLTDEQNKLANYIFNQNTTWKDDFGQIYFQPEKRMTRGEGAYILATISNNKSGIYLTYNK